MQKRIMSLLLVFIMVFSSIITVNASENVPLNISLAKVENFENNKDAVIEWNVKNNSDALVKANYVTALYEANSNKMISYSYVNDIVNANETKNYGVCMPIPEQGKFNIKAFAWDNMAAPNLLSNIYELKQEENKPTDINQIVKDAINKTGKYLVNKISEPGISSIGGEWTVLALARAGYQVPTDYFNNYYKKVIHKTVSENSKVSGRWNKKVTDVERVALALTAIGYNPADVDGINLLDYIWDKAGHFPSLNAEQGILGGRQGSNELIFGLLALDSKDYKQPESATITREQIINKLLSEYQLNQGGFALSGNKLNLDMTAMAIQALVPYYADNNDVKVAVDKALVVLSNAQRADGAFSTDDGVTSETLSQVITALTSMNINPNTDTRFVKGENTLITAFLKFYVEGGGFKHTLDGEIDGMATEQGMYALVAYDRLIEGKNSLYNMTDVEDQVKEPAIVDVTNITLSESSLELNVDENVTLTATILPEDATNKNIIWKSSNDEVAIVSNGKITAKTSGTAEITATSESDESIFARCNVTVNKEQSTEPTKKIGTAQLSIEKRIIGKGDTLSRTQVDLFEGDTAWDIIKRTVNDKEIEIKYSGEEESQYGSVYIQSIDGDGEFDHGSGSGWMFCVNDEFPPVGVSMKDIADGDVIRLKYVTSYADSTKTLVDILKRYIEDTTEYLSTDYTKNSYDHLLTAVDNAKVIANDEEYQGSNIGDEKELIINNHIAEILTAVDGLEQKQSSEPADSSIPDDFTNDLWLNTNYQVLEVGDTYKLVSRRVPEIIDDPINNRVAHPPYNYKVIEGNSIELQDTTGSEMTITAESLGTSIIEVSYDETSAYGKNYDAVSRVNKTYMIVDVVEDKEQNSIELNTDIKTRSYDTIYFDKGDTVDYTFNVNTNAETVSVTCNGNEVTGNNNEFTVPLENRANIIAITATNGDQQKKLYYVIDARKIEISVENITQPGKQISVGDEVKVSFRGITMPVYKLATIYNPTWYAPNGMWGATYGTTVRYKNEDLGDLISYDNVQYELAEHNAIKFTATEAKTYNFTNGYIDCEWWGSALGSERDMTGPGNPNLNADTLRDKFSIMPDFSIEVADGVTVTELTLNTDEIELSIGEKEQLTAKILPESATNKNIIWSSSNEEVATVLDGKITAKTPGTVKIIATSEANDTIFAECKVTVNEQQSTEPQNSTDIANYFNNKNNYDVFYYTESEKDNLTLNGEDIEFNNENQISYGGTTADFRNKLVSYSINAGEDDVISSGEEIVITFNQLDKPIGSVTGKWNSSYAGEVKSTYSTDIEGLAIIQSDNYKINDIKLTIPENAKGEYHLVEGYIFEKANEWSPGIEGIGTEGNFGRLPDITLKINQPSAKIGTAQLSIEKRIIGKGDTLSKTQVDVFEGDTAWDIIKRTVNDKGIEIEYSGAEDSQYGSVYIQSIDGDGEFDHGSGSGWMFCVNDEFPPVGVSMKDISDGDVIRIKYVTSYADSTKTLVDILKRYIEDTTEYMSTDYTKNSYDNLVTAVNNAKAIANDEQYQGANIGDKKELIINNHIAEILTAIDGLEQKQSSEPADSSIPDDFTNDLWLNTNYQVLEVGDTYKLVSRRVPEIIDNPISNSVAHPPYNYKVIEGNSIDLQNTTDSEMTITAESLGTSIIEVSYDETSAYGRDYDAVSQVNKAYMIVDVVEDKETNSIELNTDIKTRSYDTIYFDKGDTVDYTFDVNTNAETVAVTCNGNEITGNDNEFTVPLENRANIIGITATNGDEQKKLYYVIDARKIEVNITNLTSPGEKIAAGNEVRVDFKGITMPVYKLATIYNPTFKGFGAEGTTVRYTNDDLGELVSYGNRQYDLAEHNSIKFTVSEAKTYNFTDGYIYCEWWGSPLGTEKDMTGPGEANLNAPVLKGKFSILPDFSIEVIPAKGVSELTLDKEAVELIIGDNEQLNATVKPDNATNKNVIFTSSNTDVATVDEKGLICAISEGTTVITAKSQVAENITDTCDVTVNSVPVIDVILDKDTAEIEEKQNVTLIATTLPDNSSNKNVNWTSSDEKIATVNDGVVTGIKAGEVTITCTSEDSGISAKCEITVIKELPATQEEKEALKDLIDEAQSKDENEYIASSWNKFTDKLSKAEEVFNNENALIDSVNEIEKQLRDAMNSLLKPLGLNVLIQVDEDEPIESTTVQTTTGSNITIIIDGLEAPETSDGQVHELRTKFDTDMPGIGTIQSEQARDDENQLTKIIFEIPDVEPGTYTLTNGRVYKSWGGFRPQGFWIREPNREDFYQGQIPNITIEIK